MLDVFFLKKSFSAGLNGGDDTSSSTFLIIVTVVPIAAVILLVAVVLLSVPKTRMMLFPHRDRTSHQSQPIY